MRKILLALLAVVSICGAISAQGINFSHNLDEAIAKAKQENKLVFVDFYTSWCGPCKMLAKNVFPQEKVGKYFNSRFVNCKIQCDDKGIGKELSKKYQIIAYPTLMFIDKEGNIVHSMAGGPDADGLIKFAEEAFNPELNLITIVRKYESGDRSIEVVRTYYEKMKKGRRNVKASEDFAKYFATLSNKQRNTKFIYDLIMLVGAAPFSEIFEYVENNREEYYEVASKEKVDDFIAKTYLGYLSNLQRNNIDEYKPALMKFKAKEYPYYEEYLEYLNVFDVVYAVKGKCDVEEYMKRGTEFLKKYGEKDDGYTLSLTSMLGNLSWGKDKSLTGIKWMEDLLKRNRDPRYLRTYFYIFQRNLRWDESKKVAIEIRDYYIKNNIPTKSIDKQISDIARLKEKYK